MQVTLKMVEKMDELLDETEELIKCANMHSDDSELKRVYVDLAMCHYEGYEKLCKVAERTVERKAASLPEGQTVRQMMEWHKDKFDDRAAKIKNKLEKIR